MWQHKPIIEIFINLASSSAMTLTIEFYPLLKCPVILSTGDILAYQNIKNWFLN